MYDVHVSGSFLVSKSLAARIYLVLMRLMARDYVAASRLISACATDTPFDGEERWLMSMVKETADDWHPDAHACRLRLALICLECGETQLLEEEWKVEKNNQELLSIDLDGYFIQKYNHVSASCRLLPEDETELMRYLQAAKLPKGAPFGPGHFKERTKYLAAVAKASDMRPNAGSVTFAVPAASIKAGGQLVVDCIATAPETLGRAASMFTQKVCYARPKQRARSGAELFDTLDSMWEDKPFGKKSKLGFLLLFEMLTGRVGVTISGAPVDVPAVGGGGAEDSDPVELDDFGNPSFVELISRR
jgi:hypothetical protein